MLNVEFNHTILLVRHRVINANLVIVDSMVGLLSYNMYLCCIWMQKSGGVFVHMATKFGVIFQRL